MTNLTSMSEKRETITLEYILKTSPGILFSRLSTTTGLSEWFADNVTVEGNIYTFIWDKTAEQAELLQVKENKLVRFRWLETDDDDEECNYFQFQISIIELTGETVLTVTDFADSDEVEDSIELWNEQIDQLKTNLGSA